MNCYGGSVDSSCNCVCYNGLFAGEVCLGKVSVASTCFLEFHNFISFCFDIMSIFSYMLLEVQ